MTTQHEEYLKTTEKQYKEKYADRGGWENFSSEQKKLARKTDFPVNLIIDPIEKMRWINKNINKLTPAEVEYLLKCVTRMTDAISRFYQIQEFIVNSVRSEEHAKKVAQILGLLKE